MTVRATPEQMAEKFWAKVDRRAASECWPWMGCRNGSGYGSAFYEAEGIRKVYGAHAVALHSTNGQLARHHDEVIMHSCDNRLCCNPAHLSLGTRLLNAMDMVAKGRQNRKAKIFGERHPNSKFTEPEIRSIRQDHDSGKTYLTIARERGVRCWTIEMICRRMTWKHVL